MVRTKAKGTMTEDPSAVAVAKVELALLNLTTADVAPLVGDDRDDLSKWFNLYLTLEEDPGSNTRRAKVRDIEWFLRFFHHDAGGYHCDDWTKGRTKSFVSWITQQSSEKTGRQLAPTTCKRIFDTVKHAAGWIHRHRPFLAGHPARGLKGTTIGEPSWQGLPTWKCSG